VCAAVVWGQAGAGSGAVSGTIKEPGGDGIPDTVVELSNPELGLRRVMATTDDGLFTAPALNPAGGYKLKVTHKGFAGWDSAEFEVSIGQTINFEVTLKREAAESEPNDGQVPAPQVRDLKAGTASLITQAQVDGLPSATHRADPLVATAPLVTTDDRTGRLAIAGQPYLNAFLADGILTTNTYSYGQAGSGQAGIAPALSLDAVHQLQVPTADQPAEFGYAMGGVVNAATRSGSEEYHGTVYEYLRTGGLSAAGRYARGERLLDRRNQFGATIGGPVQQRRIFFFANAEVWDERGTGLNRITTPTLADPLGLSIAPANCKATAAQCAAAIGFLQAQMNVPVGLRARAFTGLAKLDYRRSDRNQFTLAANAMNGVAPNGGGAAQVAANGGLLGIRDTADRSRYGKLGWTSAPTPNTVNEMRFGLVEDRLRTPASEANLATGNVGITVADATVGNPQPYTESLNERRYQFVDNLTAAMNTHTFRAGADLSFTRDTVSELNSGSYLYPTLTNFAQDFTAGGRDYSWFTQEFGTGLRPVASRLYNLYAMDTWRPVDRLTIVAGVRWERPHREQPPQANPSYYETGTITSPVVDFAPRISMALRADEHTVIRLGYAWFYAPMPGELLDALFQGNGVLQTAVTVNPNQAGAPLFPNVIPASAIPAGTTDLMYASSKLRDPHTQQLNLVVERTLARGTTLSISATRARGFKLTTVNDANLGIPTVTKTYTIDDASGAQTGTYSTLIWNARNDPSFAHIYNVLDTGSSWYRAVAAELRKRMGHGLSVEASYTWSHTLDDVGGPTVAGFLPLSTAMGAVTADRADSPVDQRQRAAIAWMWQPSVRSGSTALRHIVNGWAVSGIATLASGHPVTPLVLVSGQQFSGVTMQYTDSLNGSGGWNRAAFEPFGSLFTGTQHNLDARISRTVDFTERVKGVLLFEAFNAFNTQYITSVNPIAWIATPTAPPAGAVTGPMSGILRPVNGAGAGNATSAPRQAQVAFRIVF
jgi:hypothetical protein